VNFSPSLPLSNETLPSITERKKLTTTPVHSDATIDHITYHDNDTRPIDHLPRTRRYIPSCSTTNPVKRWLERLQIYPLSPPSFYR
jgi:hypothetical protein